MGSLKIYLKIIIDNKQFLINSNFLNKIYKFIYDYHLLFFFTLRDIYDITASSMPYQHFVLFVPQLYLSLILHHNDYHKILKIY